MSRYFIEVYYKGTNYSGFQVQQNANSIQAELERALNIFFRSEFQLAGSSRTDAGVHAIKNYFHFDTSLFENETGAELNNAVYHLNAILPGDIVVKSIYKVRDDAHCRFDAISREYQYIIYQNKDPFLADRAFYFPYKLDMGKLQQAATTVLDHEDFTSFSKRNTQVKTFLCNISESTWLKENSSIIYRVKGNRFLRGMVRGLVGTMLKVGTGKISVDEFIAIIENKDAAKADFSVPAHGLFLLNVEFLR